MAFTVGIEKYGRIYSISGDWSMFTQGNKPTVLKMATFAWAVTLAMTSLVGVGTQAYAQDTSGACIIDTSNSGNATTGEDTVNSSTTIGAGAMACGNNNDADGNGSVAVGVNNNVDSAGSLNTVAFGASNIVQGSSAGTVVGIGNTLGNFGNGTSGVSAFVAGTSNNVAEGSNAASSVVIGANSSAGFSGLSNGAIVIGAGSGVGNVALDSTGAIAIGSASFSNGLNATTLGSTSASLGFWRRCDWFD